MSINEEKVEEVIEDIAKDSKEKTEVKSENNIENKTTNKEFLDMMNSDKQVQKKIGIFGRLIISIADQTIVAFAAFVLFYLVKFILMPLGYAIIDTLGIYFFAYIASSILYFTIVKSIYGKTIGEKALNQ
ncbi:hypothetical protein [Clostridium sp. 'White wine YQ']|uniref:hypothetical protein n=1 Tax=Clostridium sp. 'White wine YQ' TaxID=3027474 RepID=UPI0023654D27|nr:hypothetical protein [Clostridium sp. 'White wine YQ']MDD7794857.1 hypothetical protein [Clostridium sp. 'White wine YQ']